jgi:hypothetical protein
MAAHSEIIGNEVYVYMNGSLLYKRWLNTGQTKLFTKEPSFAYDKHTLFSITDDGVKNNLTGEVKPINVHP